jgi:hypothetical protein
MLLRQCFKTRTDIVELIDFAQDRLKRHGHTALLLRNLRWGELQMDWLRSEDLKEEKVVIASKTLYHARRRRACSKLT